MAVGSQGGRWSGAKVIAVVVALVVIGGGFVATAPAAEGLALVTLSGTFTADGSPVANAPVDFSGTSDGTPVNISTSTDASGDWSLHPFAGTTGTLTVDDWIISGHVNLTVGSSDQVENIDLPTQPVTENIQVVDGDGNPVPNVTVDGSTPGNSYTTTTATSDGSVLTWGTAAVAAPGVALCTTDASGSCSMTTFDGQPGTFVSALGLTGTVTAAVSDPYGSDTSYPTTFTGQVTGTAETDPESTTIVVDWTHSLVDLTGTVMMAGSPVSGAAVSFDGLSTTTDADGTYTLHPFPNSSGTLSVASGSSSTSEPVSLGAGSSEVDVDLPPPPPPGDGITLSGTILWGTYGLSGVTVTLGDLSTTTGPNGAYSLQPAPGTTGTLDIGLSYEGIPLFADAPVVVGASDQVDDVNIPIGFGTVDVSLVDSNGNPLSGGQITGQVPSQTAAITGTTSDGSTVEWGVGAYTGSMPPPTQLCTTGSDGTCSYQATIGLQEALSATVSPYGSDPSYPSSLTASMTTVATQDVTDVTFPVPTGSVVALSGTATLNGHVLSGVTVSLGGIHTTTDANGNYVLHPYTGTTGNLTVTDGAFLASSAIVVGDADQEDDIDASDPGVVLLSGSVTLDGSPQPYGLTSAVTFDGASTTSDSSGNFAMFVPVDATGTLSTTSAFSSSSALTTGATDVTDDVVIPSSNTGGTFAAVDGAGNPLSNMTISINDVGAKSPILGTTSTGAAVTWWTIPTGGSCVTGTDGTCSIPTAYSNIPVTLSGTEALVPGNSSYPTLSESTSTTIPGDGSPATLSFPNVSSLSSAGSVSGSVLLATAGSSTIQDASSSPISSSLLPDGLTAPVGSISYSVYDVTVGGSIDVYVQLPDGTVPSAIYKELPDGSLVDVTSLATIDGNTIDLHLTDGGPGDADGVANGVIEDPLIPVVGTIVYPSFQVATTSLAPIIPGHAIDPVTLSVGGETVGATLKWKKVALPKGLKLSSSGVLSGTPSKKLAAGSASVEVQVTETVVTINGRKKVKTTKSATASIPVQVT